jgi:cobalt-zinc-cadmium resistance protein CzcA
MNRIVAFALKQQALMVALFVFVCAAGLVSFLRLNIEAYPDPVPPLVDIVMQNPGQSTEEMERYVTIPLEIQMAGIPHVSAIRTISLFGLSDVKLQFTYDVTYDEAEQAAINQLSSFRRCQTASSRRSRPIARSARSSDTGSSDRRAIP